MITFCKFVSKSKHIMNSASFMLPEYRKVIIVRLTLAAISYNEKMNFPNQNRKM